MLNKNDPLVGAIQDIMSKNQAERDAVKAVNEKFGVQDRRVLPREKQGEWDAAYQTILTEGVEALEEMSTKQKMFAKVGAKVNPKDNPKTIGKHDLEAARQGHASHIGEDQDPSVNFQKMPYIVKKGEKKNPPVPMPNAPLKPAKDKFANAVKLEEDDTPMTKMGIKKPDYAPEGETPDYAKTKEQTPNRAAKSSLPAGTIKEAVMNKIMKKLKEGSMEDTMGEFKRGKLHSGSKTGPIVTDRDQAIAIGMNSKKTVSEEGFSDQKGSPNEKIKSVFSNMFSNFTKPADPAKINSAWSKPKPEPAKSSAPPAVSTATRDKPPAPESSSSTQTMQRGAEQDKVGMKRPGAVAPAQVPVPKPKPVTGNVVKPTAQKLKPVRKQPTTGAVKSPSVAAKPKLTPLQKQMRRSKTGRNAEAGPGNPGN